MKRILFLIIILYPIFILQGQNSLTEVQGDINISGGFNFSGFSSNVSNDYLVSLPLVLINGSDVSSGLIVSFLVSAGNTGPSTLSVDNGNLISTPRSLLRRGNLHLAPDDLIAGEIAMAIFNGTDWQLIHPAYTIPGYLTNCNGLFVNLLTSNNHCGSCENQCPAGFICQNGSCLLSCHSGLTKCDGICVNLDTDRSYCGSCLNECDPGHICQNGTCVLSCQVGLTKCGSLCVNTTTDNNNCGSCGNQCPAGEICQNGSCTISCQVGLTKCGSLCVNTDSNNEHCGSCGNQCGNGFKCENGTCVACD